MKRLLWTCTMSLALIAPAAASVSQGDTELDVLGGWLGLNTQPGVVAGSNNVTNWFLVGRLGYFVTNEIQLGASVLGAWADAAGTNMSLYGFGGTAKYHFMTTNQAVPYIGAQIVWAQAQRTGAATTDGWMWGPVAGLRYELNPTNDLFVEYQYHKWQGKLNNMLDNSNMVLVGITHQFK